MDKSSSGASPGELTNEGWEERMREILKKKVEAFNFEQYNRLRVGFHDLVSALRKQGSLSPRRDSPEDVETVKRPGEAENCFSFNRKLMKRDKSKIAGTRRTLSPHDGKGTIRVFFPDVSPRGDFSTVLPQHANRLTAFYLLPASSVEKSMSLDRAKKGNHRAPTTGDSKDVQSDVSRSQPSVLSGPLSMIEDREERGIASSRTEGNLFSEKGVLSSGVLSRSDGDDRKPGNMLHSDREEDFRRAAFTHQQEDRQGSCVSESGRQDLVGGDAEKREASFSLEQEHTMKTFRWNLLTTPKGLCNDNGVMIAWAALYTLQAMDSAAVCERQFGDVSSFARHHAVSFYRPYDEKEDKGLLPCHSEVKTGRAHYVTGHSTPSCASTEKTRSTSALSMIFAGKEGMMETEEGPRRREVQTNEGQGSGELPTGDEVTSKDYRNICERFNLHNGQYGESFSSAGVDSAIQTEKGIVGLLPGHQERNLVQREDDLMVGGGQDENRVFRGEKNKTGVDRPDVHYPVKDDNTGKGLDGGVPRGHNRLPIQHLEKRKASEKLKVQGSDRPPIRASNDTDTVEENISLCLPTIRGKERKDDKALVIPKWLGGDSLCDDNILGTVELLILECILNQ